MELDSEAHINEVILYKAEVELKETSSTRKKAIEHLRKSLFKKAQSKGLQTPLDEDFLLLFLRARKFNTGRALDLITSYYTIRQEHCDLFSNFTPQSVSYLFEEGVVLPLPRVIPLRSLTILVRVEKWSVEHISVEDIFKAMLITLEHKVRKNLTNQVMGFSFIFDMQGLNFSHVAQFTPGFARRSLGMLENAFPARVKGLHHINVPSVVEGVFQVFKPFLTDKMKKRFVVTSSSDFVLDRYPTEEIPDYMGGELNLDKCVEDWKAEILSDATQNDFNARSQWGIKPTSPPVTKGKTNTDRYQCDEW